jgi:hypothetical protein
VVELLHGSGKKGLDTRRREAGTKGKINGREARGNREEGRGRKGGRREGMERKTEYEGELKEGCRS